VSPHDSLRATEERLRQAVAAGTYPQAQKLLLEYRPQLEEVLRSLSPASPQAAKIARDSKDLVEWMRRMVLASRASATTQLARLPKYPLPYRAGPPAHRHTWELEA